jgi:hypothetical protein
MFYCEQYDHKIDFTDDINITPSLVSNISDAVRVVRDAVCHLDSHKNFMSPDAKISFFPTYGQFGPITLDEAGNEKGFAKYADDVCFFYGTQQLYLKRHIVRAFEEAKQVIEPLLLVPPTW